VILDVVLLLLGSVLNGSGLFGLVRVLLVGHMVLRLRRHDDKGGLVVSMGLGIGLRGLTRPPKMMAELAIQMVSLLPPLLCDEGVEDANRRGTTARAAGTARGRATARTAVRKDMVGIGVGSRRITGIILVVKCRDKEVASSFYWVTFRSAGLRVMTQTETES
jgi:hypothetical protein